MRELPRSMQETDCLRCENVQHAEEYGHSQALPVSMTERCRETQGHGHSITEADLPELPEGQFYVRDLIGMEVEERLFSGIVTDVLQNTAQDIFEVKRDDGKTVLIPKVDAFVQKIDGKERLITVTLIEGLTDL